MKQVLIQLVKLMKTYPSETSDIYIAEAIDKDNDQLNIFNFRILNMIEPFFNDYIIYQAYS